MKAASSNSDLLNDLFAPPGGQAGAVQEDLFFSGPTSAATPDSKRKIRGLLCAGCIIIKKVSNHTYIIFSLRLCFSHGRPV